MRACRERHASWFAWVQLRGGVHVGASWPQHHPCTARALPSRLGLGQIGGITASLQALLIGPSWRCPPRSVASSSGFLGSALLVGWPPHRAFLAVPSSFGGLLIGPSWRCPLRSVASSSGLLGGALLDRWPSRRAFLGGALLVRWPPHRAFLAVPSLFGGLLIGPSSWCPPRSVAS